MATAIITDLNRCVGCLACATACKGVNNVPIGNYWNKVVRVLAPTPSPAAPATTPTCTCTSCPSPASTARTPSA